MDAIHSFGYWVRRQRKALDLTQKTLARQVPCSAAMIRKIEADERKPSAELAERLGHALAVPAGRRDAFLAAARGLGPVADLPFPDNPRPTTRTPSPARLPSPTTPFLGREKELAREVRDRSFTTMSLSNLAFHRYALGHLDQAASGFRAAVAEACRFGLNHSIMHGLLGLALTAAAQEQAQRALTILTFGQRKPGPAQMLLLGQPSRVLADLRAELPPAKLAAAEEGAIEMTLEEMLDWL